MNCVLTCSDSHGSLWHSHVEPVQHHLGHLLRAIMLDSSPDTHCLLPPTSQSRLLCLKVTPSFRQIQSLIKFNFYRHGYCNRINCKVRLSSHCHPLLTSLLCYLLPLLFLDYFCLEILLTHLTINTGTS